MELLNRPYFSGLSGKINEFTCTAWLEYSLTCVIYLLAVVSKYPTRLSKTIKIPETFQHFIIYGLAFSWSQDVVSESFLIYHSVSFTKQDEILFANSILPCLNQNKALKPPMRTLKCSLYCLVLSFPRLQVPPSFFKIQYNAVPTLGLP